MNIYMTDNYLQIILIPWCYSHKYIKKDDKKKPQFYYCLCAEPLLHIIKDTIISVDTKN